MPWGWVAELVKICLTTPARPLAAALVLFHDNLDRQSRFDLFAVLAIHDAGSLFWRAHLLSADRCIIPDCHGL